MMNTSLNFNDKVMIVTGGGSGIGKAVCLAMASLGAQIIIVDIDSAMAEDTAAAITGNKPPLVLTGDIQSETQMTTIAATVVDTFNRIDALIHCAGILRYGGRGPRPMVDISLEEWDAVININLKGTFLCNRAVLPAMIRQRSGHIINLSSTSGIQGRAFDTAYCASKFGVIGLSHSLAEEMRHYGVRVNVILPDAVDTPIWEQNGPLRQPEESLPPDRVAELIAFIIGLPDDTMLGDVVIKAFKTRRRKKKQKE
jgi:NAD(P)-dependent dehydrogenase (short-subunit alcohol dehydrogenase family)